jgi:hypothetical protein
MSEEGMAEEAKVWAREIRVRRAWRGRVRA